MAQKIIKHRLFTWFKDVDSPMQPGTQVRMEMINHFGDDVDISDEASIARGEELDSFFSDAEAKQIRAGTFTGPQAKLLKQFASGQRPTGAVEPLAGEGPDVSGLSTEDLAAYINENKLNVDATVALADASNTESITKIYDAEQMAADARGSDARKGVTDRLDVLLAAASQA